ncbi:MAG TPA: hypothetical protein VNA04_00655 [Thermoanaerobaculia bacterium]|nr:hypothetical protein [Thermoanaerobaculia bacterium]
MMFLLLIVTASFRPAAPAIGDLITIEFQEAVVLDPSPDYEVVEHDGPRVVVRTFRPEPFELSGRLGNVAFRRLVVPVTSVLQPDDTMQPAPLKEPLPPAASRRPLVAVGSAAVVAALAWLAVVALARRAAKAAMPRPDIPAAERFRIAIEQLRRDPSRPDRWAALADATRRYLAATEPALGRELTTGEVLRVLDGAPRRDTVAAILRQGDLEKFSPWGARPADFDAAAESALALIPEPDAEAAA